MAKKVIGTINLVIPAGGANPSPPVGPALGQKGVNIMSFCKDFNEASKAKAGWRIPVVITVYEDKSFSYVMKEPPASELIKKMAGVQKGTDNPLKNIVGKITRDQLRQIAEQKIVDMNTTDIEMAMNTIAGSARAMGVQIVD